MTTPIIILILLASPLLFAFIIAKLTQTKLNIHKYACWGLGIAFIFFSIGHFFKTNGMVQMLPSWVTLRLEIIYATGILELIVGMSLFFSKLQTKAALVAIMIFVIFLPANIYAALNSVGLGGHQWGPIYLVIRIPLQLILIAWAYLFCVRNNG